MNNFLLKCIFPVAAVGMVSTAYADVPERESRTDYSLSFFKSAVLSCEDDANVIVSPYSAGVALSMLADGAEGKTLEEISTALSGASFAGDRVCPDSTVDIRSANSAWLREGFRLKDSYGRRLGEGYGARIGSLDFEDPASAGVINGWCSENTAGRIPTIIESIPADVVMFLMNALYFKAPWKNAFNESFTEMSEFHGDSGDSESPFMSGRFSLRYAEYYGCKIVEIPYSGDRYSMTVMLPDESMDINEAIAYMDGDIYREVLGSLSVAEVNLRMPKFRFETDMSLNGTLSMMGIRKVFSPAAELGRIAKGRISVDEVKQKCFLEVNEQGSEAAAVTSIGIRMTSASVSRPVSVNVNRPFVFAITDSESGDILFAGKIMNL